MTEARRKQTAPKQTPATPVKALLALLRYVAGHEVRVLDNNGASKQIQVQRAGEAVRVFDRALVLRAQAAGLLVCTRQTIAVTPEAATFIRRALVEPEDGFQTQHRDLRDASILIEGIRQTVKVNDQESPLAGIARLKDKTGQAFLPQDAIDAGERLHADFTRAHLQPRLTMAYEPRLSSKTRGTANAAADLTDTALAARLRVEKAIDAMGPELSGVALDICCFMKGLELVERERQWPARSAKLMLRTALMALARHYAPPVTSGSRRSHVWGGDGFRPSF